MIKGIDISHWNGIIDFDKVRMDGYKFVIIKAGGSDRGFYTDPMFNTNYEKARAADLFIGAYYFAGKNFRGADAGRADAQRFIDILKDKEFTYPVYLDIEAQDNRYKKEITEAAKAFCEDLEKAGYFVGIYASDVSGFKDKLIHEDIKQFAHWVARYGKEPEVCKTYGIWQYTSKGSVSGISGSVDLDISKVDYAGVITEKGFNNISKPKEIKAKSKKQSTKTKNEEVK